MSIWKWEILKSTENKVEMLLWEKTLKFMETLWKISPHKLFRPTDPSFRLPHLREFCDSCLGLNPPPGKTSQKEEKNATAVSRLNFHFHIKASFLLLWNMKRHIFHPRSKRMQYITLNGSFYKETVKWEWEKSSSNHRSIEHITSVTCRFLCCTKQQLPLQKVAS